MHKAIARERMQILMKLAAKAFSTHPKRAHRYVQLTRRIGKRYNVALPVALRRRVCRTCDHYLQPGVNARVRSSVKQQAVVVRCLDCQAISRIPYRREKTFK